MAASKISARKTAALSGNLAYQARKAIINIIVISAKRR
jgi:hypothetical protein